VPFPEDSFGSQFGNLQFPGGRGLFGDWTSTPVTRYGWSAIKESSQLTGWKAFAEQLSSLCRSNGFGVTNDLALINCGLGGEGYVAYLSVTGSVTATYSPYDQPAFTTNRFGLSMNDLSNVITFQNWFDGRGVTVPAILNVHGETDAAVAAYG